MSDGGSDADRRRWTHKRVQFDNAIHSARLLGFVQKLASGESRYQDVLKSLLEVNASADQSQYVAETLAMKKEVRGIARLEFHPEIAVFFTEASRLIPKLTDGLASQVMMLLGHAAQNDVYLDTVSKAVSELLADLDHPLNREARNYLRLLWDQMEATRRLKQTEAMFPGSSVPPSSPPHEVGVSGKLPALPVPPHRASLPESITGTRMGMAAPVRLQPDGAGTNEASPEVDHQSTLRGVGTGRSPATVEPVSDTNSPIRDATPDRAFDEQTNEFFKRSEAPPSETALDSGSGWRPAPISRPPAPQRDPDVKLPTNSVPRWAVLAASAVVAAVVAAVMYATREPEPEGPTQGEPSATASVRIPGPKPGDSKEMPAHAGANAGSQPAVSPPPPPPPARADTPPVEPVQSPEPRRAAPPPGGRAQNQRNKPAAARVAIDSPNVHPQTRPRRSATASAASVPAKTVEASESQSTRGPSIVTPAEVARSLSSLDRILAELRLISPDTLGIEEKARELSRIIATSKRKEAFYLIDHLGPPVALDALGRDPVLEESLRTFAISTLGRVALDDDDSRAVSAIFMLGEWAKSGGKGRQKAISALESLGKERIIRSSAPRSKALRSAKAQIGE